MSTYEKTSCGDFGEVDVKVSPQESGFKLEVCFCGPEFENIPFNWSVTAKGLTIEAKDNEAAAVLGDAICTAGGYLIGQGEP